VGGLLLADGILGHVIRVHFFFPHGGDYRGEDSIAAILGIVKK
jgi:hypothetical protein